MQIVLITPAGERSLSGNRRTAVRSARILESLGHHVRIAQVYDGTPADLMIAIHAFRSSEAVERFRHSHPAAPVVVVLAGTDVYRFQKSHPEETGRSMELATALVGLHDLVERSIPRHLAKKLHVIHQSAEPLRTPHRPHTRYFDVLVIGHLRPEKDTLRAAYAVRDLDGNSRLRVVHCGRALERSWQRAADAETKRNPRYAWRGEVPRWRVRRALATSRLLVLSSIMEGGANVISEAIAADHAGARARARFRMLATIQRCESCRSPFDRTGRQSASCSRQVSERHTDSPAVTVPTPRWHSSTACPRSS